MLPSSHSGSPVSLDFGKLADAAFGVILMRCEMETL